VAVQAGEGSPSVRVTVHDGRTYWAVLRHGSEGLAESYIARWWDCDDLTGLTQLLLLNLATPIDVLDRIGERSSGALSWWQRRRPPTAAADQANVRAHYDLPPRLFDLMLDETMSYSCAVFDGPEIKLADAQRAKLDRLCAKLGLGADDHLLEIGTGWEAWPCMRRELRLPGDHHHHLGRAARRCHRAGGGRRVGRSHRGARPRLPPAHRDLRQAGLRRDD